MMPTAPVPAPSGTLRVATRRSALAMTQSRMIGAQLAALTGRDLELVEVTTQGDVDLAPLAQIGGTGVFVAAVRAAVASGRADVAVHSLKDLPTAADPRLVLAAVPAREDPADVLVAAPGTSLAALPTGARVGTGSPRRRSQLAAARPDLELVEIRGNVDTRIRRVRVERERASDPSTAGKAADLDAVVLAAAGLTRLGRLAEASERLDPEVMMPAPGQGALAVEVRADVVAHEAASSADGLASSDPALATALRTLDDARTRAQVVAERALLATLEAGCSAPLGALARTGPGDAAQLHLRAVLARPDGSLLRMDATGDPADAHTLGAALAIRMLAGDDGAAPAPNQHIPNAADPSVPGPAIAHRGSSS
jgi:hydroxymethylbilane synthase